MYAEVKRCQRSLEYSISQENLQTAVLGQAKSKKYQQFSESA